jgi:prefoldin subunit 5
MSTAIIGDMPRTDEWNEWRTGTVVEIETIHQIVTKLSAEVSALQAQVDALGAALADMNAELTRLRLVNNLREVER